jgi:hypothetical protein
MPTGNCTDPGTIHIPPNEYTENKTKGSILDKNACVIKDIRDKKLPVKNALKAAMAAAVLPDGSRPKKDIDYYCYIRVVPCSVVDKGPTPGGCSCMCGCS